MEISVMLTTHCLTVEKPLSIMKIMLLIATEFGDRDREGRGYGSLCNSYQSIGDYWKAIEYHEKRSKILIEIGDRGGEGGAYGSLVNAYDSLGDFQKPLTIREKVWKLQRKLVIGPEKEEPMEISEMLTSHCGTIEKPSKNI